MAELGALYAYRGSWRVVGRVPRIDIRMRRDIAFGYGGGVVF
jgi:hypothetical protein